jgi:hypothetical protein
MLPVLNIAKYEITIPVINKKYTIRPYLVGEEKALMMALESRDQNQIRDSIKYLITSCVAEKIDVETLSSFETEYLFLQLRKISVSNMIDIGLSHQHSETCTHIQKVQLDLDTVKSEGAVNNKIILDKERNIGVMMQIPTNKILAKQYSSETDRVFGMIEGCITAIFDDKNVYYAKDISKEELSQWVNSLNNKQIQEIASFFGNLPKFFYEVKYKCDKCGEVETVKIEGLSNFL